MKKKFSIMIVLFAAGVVLAVAISSSAVQQAYRNKKIESEVRALEEEAKKIKDENETISQRISYYNTPEFVERVSKDKINLQKPEEKVVVVSQSTESQGMESSVIEDISDDSRQSMPNYIKWWRLFF